MQLNKKYFERGRFFISHDGILGIFLKNNSAIRKMTNRQKKFCTTDPSWLSVDVRQVHFTQFFVFL